MFEFRETAIPVPSLKKAFDSVLLRAKWAVGGAILGGALTIGGGLHLVDGNGCFSIQTGKENLSFCMAFSRVSTSAGPEAPTGGIDSNPSVPGENQGPSGEGGRSLDPFVPKISPDGNQDPSGNNEPLGILQNAPLSAEQQEETRRRMEWFRNPCNPGGAFSMLTQKNYQLNGMLPFLQGIPRCI